MDANLRLIPVLDLMGGEAVRARAGRREQYRALQSVLCRYSQPDAVIEGFLTLHPFDCVYIADLDAILGHGGNQATLERLCQAYPGLNFWVDAGFADADAARKWQRSGLGRAVLGSESLVALPARNDYPMGAVLSLDFLEGRFLGSPELLGSDQNWPADVIVMSLSSVGTGNGPDLARLAQLRHIAHASRLYAAGGVRNMADLYALANAGAAGVLLASALHDGEINRDALAAFHAGHRAAIADKQIGPGLGQ